MKLAFLMLALLAAAPFALAHGGWTHCGGTEIALPNYAYFVYDTGGPTAGWGYFYMESNGIIELQRGPGPYANDWCDEGVPSDTGFFLF